MRHLLLRCVVEHFQNYVESSRVLFFQNPSNQASDSDSEEEVPPPLPPPRTESLKKEVKFQTLSDISGGMNLLPNLIHVGC